jgi:hypothetical protein
MYAMKGWCNIIGISLVDPLIQYCIIIVVEQIDRPHIFRWSKLHATRNTTTSTTDCKNWKGNLVAVIEMREIKIRCLQHTAEYTFVFLFWTSLSSFPSLLEQASAEK